MVKTTKHILKDGLVKHQIRVVHGVREGKKVKQVTLKNFGYLEDSEDPEMLRKEAQAYNDRYLKEKKAKKSKRKEEGSLPFYESSSSITKNFTFRFLESIYDSFGLERVFEESGYQGQQSLNEMFKFLVITRILASDSKRATFQYVHDYYGRDYDFALYDLYRSLGWFDQLSVKVQKRLNDFISEKIGRKTDYTFYDTTNTYMEKDFEDEDVYVELETPVTDKKEIKKQGIVCIKDEKGVDHQFSVNPGLCKKGVSKEHQTTPIVQLGLMMDENAIPICMQAFPGNTADSKTLIPVMKHAKKEYGLKRTIFVADKGINCSDNIDDIVNNGDGYMFSQVLKGMKGKRYKDRLFDESAYVIVNDDYRYQIFEEEIEGKDSDGKKITRKRKVLIFWSRKDCERERIKRAQKLLKAKNAIEKGTYCLDHSFKKYIKTDAYVEKTGEVADGRAAQVDYEKANEEEKYDGYFAIVTSELDYDEAKIRKVYHGLWRIEESFRMTKSDLLLRPVFVRTPEHIRGHFLICFVALTILRIIQHRMGFTISAERIQDALNFCRCQQTEDEVINVVMAKTKKAYIMKADKTGKEYYSTTLGEDDQTIADFKELIKCYKIDVPESAEKKLDFDKKLKDIRFDFRKR